MDMAINVHFLFCKQKTAYELRISDWSSDVCSSDLLLETMTDSLAHRGPDGRGFLVDGGIGLGHRRLSIIDLAGGQQPMYNEDRSVAVVYNGEIYNFKELAAELRSAGHVFRSVCAPAVIRADERRVGKEVGST